MAVHGHREDGWGTATAESLQLIIRGEDVSPPTLSLKELNAWLELYQKLLSNTRQNSEAVSLVSVQPGSVALTFSTTAAEHVSIIEAVGDMLRLNDFDRLPKAALDVLGEMQERARRRKRQVSFGIGSGSQMREVATIDAQMHIGEGGVYRSATTIYGELVSIGEKKKPNLHIEREGMRDVVCIPTGSEGEQRRILREYASYIYMAVKVEGIGEFSLYDHSVTRLYVTALTPRTRRSFREGMRELAAASDIEGQNITDVLAYTRSLREDE